LIFLSEETTNDLMVWQIGLDGKNKRPFLSVADMEGGLDMPSVSPDAKRVAAISYRTAGAKPQVFSYALPNGPWRQLTEHAEGTYDPAWSPDGARIAYTARSRGKHDVWLMNADGSGALQLTDAGACRAPCWSPDGQQIAYISGETGTFDIYVAQTPHPITPTATAALTAAGANAPTAALQSSAQPTAAPRPSAGKPLTKGLNLDTVSGISWAR
jgi:Tol biopolymer transport system component